MSELLSVHGTARVHDAENHRSRKFFFFFFFFYIEFQIDLGSRRDGISPAIVFSKIAPTISPSLCVVLVNSRFLAQINYTCNDARCTIGRQVSAQITGASSHECEITKRFILPHAHTWAHARAHMCVCVCITAEIYPQPCKGMHMRVFCALTCLYEIRSSSSLSFSLIASTLRSRD